MLNFMYTDLPVQFDDDKQFSLVFLYQEILIKVSFSAHTLLFIVYGAESFNAIYAGERS